MLLHRWAECRQRASLAQLQFHLPELKLMYIVYNGRCYRKGRSWTTWNKCFLSEDVKLLQILDLDHDSRLLLLWTEEMMWNTYQAQAEPGVCWIIISWFIFMYVGHMTDPMCTISLDFHQWTPASKANPCNCFFFLLCFSERQENWGPPNWQWTL